MEELRIAVPDELYSPAECARFEGTLNLDTLNIGPDEYRFPNPVSWQMTMSNTGEALLVTGSCSTTAITECGRCLEPYDIDLAGEIEGYFLFEEDGEAPEEMDDDEFDYLPADGVIDAVPLIIAALVVEMPLVPLCDEECKGLCFQCGKNLNEGPCSCVKEEDDEFDKNPFAALKNLSFD